METCNGCGGTFSPSDHGLVPLLVCEDCLREVPADALPEERHGIGVCRTGRCDEPCGLDGGCRR